MSKVARVQFEGFSFIESRDTATHEVEFGTITDGEHTFVVEMIRNKSFPNLDFLVARVSLDGKEVWSFRKASWTGVGALKATSEGPAIVGMGSGKFGKVAAVIPLRSFTGRPPYSINEIIALKRGVAQAIGRGVDFGPLEAALLRKASREASEATKGAAEAEAEARREAREQRIRTILARGKVTVFAEDGSTRSGHPVVGDEWRSLSNGSYAVVYAEIDEDGRLGAPIEAFRIVREHGKGASKKNPVTVFASSPARLPSAQPKKADERKIAVEIDGDAFEVTLFDSMDAIREARAAGLNGGAYVSVNKKTATGKFEVLAIYHDGIETIGHALPIG